MHGDIGTLFVARQKASAESARDNNLSTLLSILPINVSLATVPNKANERGHCAQIFEVGVWPVTLNFGYNGLIN